MMQHLSVEHLESLLHEDVHYEAQWSFHEVSAVWLPYAVIGREEFLAYIQPRLEEIKRSGIEIFAEMGRLPTGPCVLVAQGTSDELTATVLVDVIGGQIRRLDICTVPDPRTAERTGDYPS